MATAPLTDEQPATAAAGLGRGAAAMAGVAVAAAALGVGELVAGVESGWAPPVEAVADEVIGRVPLAVERFAIETFGHDEKLALVVGVLVVSGIVGAVLGVASRRRPLVGTAGIAGFALVGVWASAGWPGAGDLAGVPSVAAGLTGVVLLWFLFGSGVRRDRRTSGAGGLGGVVPVLTRGGMGPRRAFLTLATAAAPGAAVAGAGGRALRDATPGTHTITVRATDGTGEIQTDERTGVVPDGASGWMSLVVNVQEPHR